MTIRRTSQSFQLDQRFVINRGHVSEKSSFQFDVCDLAILIRKGLTEVSTGRVFRLVGETYQFSTVSVHHSMLFSFNLLTVVISSQLQCGISMRTLSVLLSSLGGITHHVYLQMCGFSFFPQFWFLSCSWE